jgi:hypothetical protein
MRKKIILVLSLIPFFRIILKLLYTQAINKLKLLAVENDQIKDILLISKMKDHDFIYGSSDLNVIFIVQDKVYPKAFLKKVRKSLLGIWPANVFVNIENLTVFKEIEIKTPLIRSILITKYYSEDVEWQSVLKLDTFSFRLKEQDHFSIQYQYVKNLENYLLNPKRNVLVNRHWVRSFGKNVSMSIRGLVRYNLVQTAITPKWEKLSKKLIRFSYFSRFRFLPMKILSLKMIDFEVLPKEEDHDTPDNYHENLLSFTKDLLAYPIIEDIILSPALIQLNNSQIRGKVFIDIVLGQRDRGFSADLMNHLQIAIDEFFSTVTVEEPKYVFHFTTYGFLKLKSEQVLLSYPLENYYRTGKSYSVSNIKYNFELNRKQIEKASVHYLLQQFMRFRTLEQKNVLIGSRFIKSLNIIYRYQLLLNFLRGQEFAVSHSYKSILEELSPQLSNIKPNTEVDAELWRLIRAQMLFILKRVRDELAKKSPSLKNLQF